ncbi:MAG: hypothetical protein HY875_00095 [Chloroflexi bacterium]|nr:hypothetical protein [Chloroflexota bacterium]
MDGDDAFGLVLWTTDIPALAGFLQQAGGMTLLEQHPGYASLRAGATTIALHADESYRGHPWYDALRREGAARGIGAELRVRVADVATAYATALRLGGQAVQPPYDDAGIRECQVMGPDGYLVSLWAEAGG